MKTKTVLPIVALCGALLALVCPTRIFAADSFDGLNLELGNLYRVSDAQSRSISPENFTGEKGKAGMATEGTGKNAARDLGQGWKISPSVHIAAHKSITLADITGPGAIQQIWLTPAPVEKTRWQILRI